MVKVALGSMSFKLPKKVWLKLYELGFDIRSYADEFACVRDDNGKCYDEDNNEIDINDGLPVVYFFNGYKDGTGRSSDMNRFQSDPIVIQVIEEFIKSGDIKTGDRSQYVENTINIVEVPDDVDFTISDGDCGGGEYVEECHRIWSDESPEGYSWCEQYGSYKHPKAW